ncbi:nidogen-like domain-containing protein [Methylomonas sp. MED-D]|uniref:nidogen-like domain-containing protein n=1 Tax=unclassified Methylomonas TaxID=2608980 RepID=UPI0028A34433|nr:nidogen-like domain-containing protein [Methylomonas sp. MV1]MDT4332548.1 nidogen-like domain-containing protein [Methylomonas sp. MV1]
MKALIVGGILSLTLAVPGSANAVSLLTLADGTFGEIALTPNDDESSSMLNLPFAVNFYGNVFNNFYVNNNGNITFQSPLSEFTPSSFPISEQPMIAPYWADVDTRCDGCGNVYVGAPNSNTTIVTWNNVGYYSEHADKTNNFQLVLRNQQNGDFDVEFRYDRLEWTTGDASNGSNGLGGTPAQAGFDAGDNVNYFTLPGSFTSDILDIANNTNVVNGDPGFWSFSIRNGLTPGATPSNPLLPVVVDGAFVFDFNVQPEQPIFIDPEVAVGYDYEVTSGPNIASVLLPTNLGDGIYDLYLWENTEYVFAAALTAGIEYFFEPGGVSRFRILGIEVSAGLDPNNPQAFVTGLTFVGAGAVSLTQTPLVSQVPLPASGLLMFSGLLAVGSMKLSRSARSAG